MIIICIITPREYLWIRECILRQLDLDRLFLLHGQEIERYLARQVNCTETAADLTQEAFFRLLQHNGRDSIKNVRAFLFRIASNLAKDHLRKSRRRQTETVTPENLTLVADKAPPMDRRLEDRERLEVLSRAIAELPARTQDIFKFNRIQGLSYNEIARRMGISESTVQKHLATALAHATTRLQRYADKS